MTAPTTEPTGATPPAEPTTPAAPPAAPETGDLGDAGKKAIAAEREARKALEQKIKELESRDPVKALMEALGQKPAPGQDPVEALAERVAKAEERASTAEMANLRTQVRDAKGLTAAQAAELSGSTLEQLEAHADRLLAAFRTQASTTPGTPAPDPSQGARGGAQALEAELKAAQEKGDARAAIRIKQLLAEQRKPK